MSALRKLLLESMEIRKLIVHRSTEHNIPLKYLCEKVGINYQRFMFSYIRAENDPDVSEEKFLKLLELLGVTLRFQLVVDKSVDMGARRLEITEWYEQNRL